MALPHQPLTRRALIAATVAVLCAALGTFAWTRSGSQADAAKPARLTAVPAIADTLTIGGTTKPLPWPTNGQAALYIDGIGQLARTRTPDAPQPIASVTKIMTAYLILRDHPLALGAGGPTITITAPEAAAYPNEKALGQSAIPVTAGEHLTERQALEALLVPSANNIARILARWHSGTITRFLTQMNAAATALGMTHTRYTDPSGWDPTTVSTIDDQLKLAQTAMTIPTFAAIVKMPTTKLPVAGAVRNINKLLGTAGVIGIKTGSMSAAGGCLIFAATITINGQPIRILGGVLGQTSLAAAFTRSQSLITAVGRLIHPYTLIHAGDVVAHASNGAVLTATTDVRVLGWPGLRFHSAFDLNLGTHTETATTVGTLTITGLGEPIRTTLAVA